MLVTGAGIGVLLRGDEMPDGGEVGAEDGTRLVVRKISSYLSMAKPSWRKPGSGAVPLMSEKREAKDELCLYSSRTGR